MANIARYCDGGTCERCQSRRETAEHYRKGDKAGQPTGRYQGRSLDGMHGRPWCYSMGCKCCPCRAAAALRQRRTVARARHRMDASQPCEPDGRRHNRVSRVRLLCTAPGARAPGACKHCLADYGLTSGPSWADRHGLGATYYAGCRCCACLWAERERRDGRAVRAPRKTAEYRAGGMSIAERRARERETVCKALRDSGTSFEAASQLLLARIVRWPSWREALAAAYDVALVMNGDQVDGETAEA